MKMRHVRSPARKASRGSRKKRFGATFRVETGSETKSREAADRALELARQGSCGLAMSFLVRSEYLRGKAAGCEGGDTKRSQATYDAVRRCFMK